LRSAKSQQRLLNPRLIVAQEFGNHHVSRVAFQMVETSDEWIYSRVGIRERYLVEKGIATSDMAVECERSQPILQRSSMLQLGHFQISKWII
jgi:3-oxoacyl-[acyl-carrier-protein] synthase III